MTLIPNTFHIECRALGWADYASADELRRILATRPLRPLLHVGGGSNLLFTRPTYEGLVLHNAMRQWSATPDGDHVLLTVGGGMVWDELVQLCVARGWHGLENLSLIPGEVGAAAVQNIGAFGAEAADSIHRVECLHLSTGQERAFDRAELQYGYRHSLFKAEAHRGQWAVLRVTFRLPTEFRPVLTYDALRRRAEALGIDPTTLSAAQVRDMVVDIRRQRLPDPEVTGSAGSFFKNPVVSRELYEQLSARHPDMPSYPAPDGVKLAAGWLIDQCGWRGRALGRAAVHHRQALVLVNQGGATGADVLALCRAVQSDVRTRFGVELEPEVNIIE